MASFVDANTVAVAQADGTTSHVRGRKILIACGGVPAPPDIPGKELTTTSDGFFDLPTQPKKVAVVGAGYVAVELAGILHALGSETHLFFRGETVLRNEDILKLEVAVGEAEVDMQMAQPSRHLGHDQLDLGLVEGAGDHLSDGGLPGREGRVRGGSHGA